MKRILVNSTHEEEKRIAVVQNDELYDIDIEPGSIVQVRSNIYLGKVSRVEQSLDAAFVDYGAERHGFLPFKEIHRSYAANNGPVKEGQIVLVQVEKNERGNKGAALTTLISLAGRYLVFMPNNDSTGGISRRVDEDERRSMRDILKKLPIEPGSSIIIRTAGVSRTHKEILNDLEYLRSLWKQVLAAKALYKAPQLIYSDNGVVTRVVRDYLQDDIDEVVFDDEQLYQECMGFIRKVAPNKIKNIVYYDDDVLPLFSRFQLEEQVERTFFREVQLKSGGAIIIDQTEALVSIDINSSKSNKGSDIEATALHTNVEACDEIARQLRLRDIGGLIVIDFIDMTPSKNIREVENRLRAAMQGDRARVQIGKISRFGLMELSRQRLRSSLLENSTVTCPKCNGHGVVRTTESAAISILRLIQQQACKEHTAQIRARLPLPIATLLLNEKRSDFSEMEESLSTSIIILPTADMISPNYEITRVMKDNRTEVFSAQSDLDAAASANNQTYRNKAIKRQKPVVDLGRGSTSGSISLTRLLQKLRNMFGSGTSTARQQPVQNRQKQHANRSGNKPNNYARRRNRNRRPRPRSAQSSAQAKG